MLAQVRSAGDAKAMVRLEIRALGEPRRSRRRDGPVIYAIAVAESSLEFQRRSFLRAVRPGIHRYALIVSDSLLSRQLRSLRSERKAYWTFIARQAAGAHDEEARRRLQAAADATDD